MLLAEAAGAAGAAAAGAASAVREGAVDAAGAAEELAAGAFGGAEDCWQALKAHVTASANKARDGRIMRDSFAVVEGAAVMQTYGCRQANNVSGSAASATMGILIPQRFPVK